MKIKIHFSPPIMDPSDYFHGFLRSVDLRSSTPAFESISRVD